MTTLQDAYGLEGKTALVTGGGTGLGFAIASCLTQAGARVIVAGRRQDILQQACEKLGEASSFIKLDISDTSSLQKIVEQLSEQHGSIDILVNNAGNTVKKPFEESNLDDFDAVFDVHVRGALELTRHVIRQQLMSGGGSILFTSSMTAFISQPNVLPYTVAKTALSGVVRALTAEFADKQIRVNAVAPGWIDTDLYQQATKGDTARQQKILDRIPARQLGDPADIGWACAFLASPCAKYITGQVLAVDGGAATGF